MSLKRKTDCSRSGLAKELERLVSQGRNKFYLREFLEETRVSRVDAEEFFLPLLKKNVVEGQLEVRCPNCSAELGTFQRYSEIPEELACELCGSEFLRSDEFLEIILEVKGKFFRGQKISPTPC